MQLDWHKRSVCRKFALLGEIGLLVLLGAWMGWRQSRLARKQAPPQLSKQVCEATLNAAARVFGPVRLSSIPFIVPPRFWSFIGHAEGMNLDLLTDANGQIYSLSTELDEQGGARMVAPLKTEAQTREVALHCFQNLDMLPAQTRLTLVTPPRLMCRRTVHPLWHMLWKVQSAFPGQSYRITLWLDAGTSLPSCIMREYF